MARAGALLYASSMLHPLLAWTRGSCALLLASLLATAACANGSVIGEGGSAATSTGGGSDGASSANGGAGGAGNTGGGATGGSTSTSCGDMCDGDGDGVLDASDACADTPAGEPVNSAGCADSQVDATLQEAWPPYNLAWTPAGDLGRVGGLTWAYAGITRGELFHIYWVLCDDPATLCGVSLDGPIDATEGWQLSAVDSDLPGGVAVFTNATHIALADGTSPAVTARLTVRVVGASDEAIPFGDMATLGITARDGQIGAEIPADAFKIFAVIEVQDGMGVWTPYLDYFDAAPTPDPGVGTAVSFGGSFYDE